MKSDTIKLMFSYLLSLATITMIFIYGLNIPTRITNAPDLVKQYYHTHYASSFVLDIFLIAIYLAIALYIANMFHITGFLEQLGMVACTTLFISGAFYLYFISTPKSSSNFFSIWFHRVQYKAVIYDIVLVSSVFAATSWLTKTLS